MFTSDALPLIEVAKKLWRHTIIYKIQMYPTLFYLLWLNFVSPISQVAIS
jgi:hypothetical protein